MTTANAPDKSITPGTVNMSTADGDHNSSTMFTNSSSDTKIQASTPQSTSIPHSLLNTTTAAPVPLVNTNSSASETSTMTLDGFSLEYNQTQHADTSAPSADNQTTPQTDPADLVTSSVTAGPVLSVTSLSQPNDSVVAASSMTPEEEDFNIALSTFLPTSTQCQPTMAANSTLADTNITETASGTTTTANTPTTTANTPTTENTPATATTTNNNRQHTTKTHNQYTNYNRQHQLQQSTYQLQQQHQLQQSTYQLQQPTYQLQQSTYQQQSTHQLQQPTYQLQHQHTNYTKSTDNVLNIQQCDNFFSSTQLWGTNKLI
ncbi:hypothetical protein EB796_023439 [Bugula neritina]|uniref:Uncharacterized protein n=1 Tax=Bugula neritina TaxID=10212 RepID=A0A7J7IYG4_BUGNE|nr:hypothetical protein EB796_023439 [Bugula neritina]